VGGVKEIRRWFRSRDYARFERVAVRVIVPLALLVAFAIAASLAVPHKLPGAALGSRWVLYGLWVLAIFYGFLLLFLPLVRALRGQLPIELSLRGPRYEEAAATTSVALKELNAELANQKALVTQLALSLEAAVERIGVLEDMQIEVETPEEPGGTT
jgi:uncharacterized coiled-coil protein SlyX